MRTDCGSSALERFVRRVANAWRSAARRRVVAASRTGLHAGRRRSEEGVRYRAWFADGARFDRLVAPVASFAWSIETSAEALRLPGTEARFEIWPLTRAEVEEFRRRFLPTRDEMVAQGPRSGA